MINAKLFKNLKTNDTSFLKQFVLKSSIPDHIEGAKGNKTVISSIPKNVMASYSPPSLDSPLNPVLIMMFAHEL